jgi:recombination protein RecR
MGTHGVLDRLASALAELPGVGRRSAERMALKLASTPALVEDLSHALAEMRERVAVCSRCGNLTTRDRDPCSYCVNPSRDERLLCVVEDVSDVPTIERSGGFRGRYHVLAGKLAASRGQILDPARVARLVERVRAEGYEEVILALSTDVDGDATAAYIAEQLKPFGVRVSRPASGLPVMSGIPYTDPVTLARALHARQPA